MWRLRGRGRSLLWFALTSSGEYILKPDPRNVSHSVSTKNLRLRRASDLAVQSIFPSFIQLEMDYISFDLAARSAGRPGGTRRGLPADRWPGDFSRARGGQRDPQAFWTPSRWCRPCASSACASGVDVSEAVSLRSALAHPARLSPESISLKARIERISQRRFTQIPLEVLGAAGQHGHSAPQFLDHRHRRRTPARDD